MLPHLLQLCSVQLGISVAVGQRTNHDPHVKICSSAGRLHRALGQNGGERRKPSICQRGIMSAGRVPKHVELLMENKPALTYPVACC